MVGVLGEVDDVVAQQDPVLQRLVVQRVGLDPGNAEGGRGAAQRHHEPVVVDGPLGQVHAPGVEIDALHAVATEAEAPVAPDVADRLDDVARLHQRGRHLGQQRGEQQVVLVADQQQLDVAPAPQAPLEPPDHLHAAEAAPEDDDARHAISSTPRSPATISPSTKTSSPAAVSRARTPSAAAGRTTIT